MAGKENEVKGGKIKFRAKQSDRLFPICAYPRCCGSNPGQLHL